MAVTANAFVDFDRSSKSTAEFLDIPCEMTTKWLLWPIFAWHMVYTLWL